MYREVEPTSPTKMRDIDVLNGAARTETIEILRQSVMFGYLSDEELERIAGSVRRFAMGPGPLFYEGDSPTNAYLLISGQVDIILYSLEGRSLLLYKIWPGELFGEMALIDDQPRSASAVARTQSDMLAFSRELMLEIISRNPAIALRMISLLSDRLRTADQTIKAITFQDVTARLARMLLEMENEQQNRGLVRTSQTELADALGCTRQSITRTLTFWRRLGYVQTGRGSVHILNRRRLQSCVRDDAL